MEHRRISAGRRPGFARLILPRAFLLVLFFALPVSSLENGLARTPPMGWNSWSAASYLSSVTVNEHRVKSVMSHMASSGLKEAGYSYINLDDTWMGWLRDSKGRLHANRFKFPSGMKAMADEAHKSGFKFGLYSSAGTMTCQRHAASLGHEMVDAQTFASWGVDFLKYDNCFSKSNVHPSESNGDEKQRYTKMRDALAATGWPILFSMCEWGNQEVWKWGAEVGNTWRIGGDAGNNWASITRLVDASVGLSKYARPGAWNDLDMLQVGNPDKSKTVEEDRAQFSMWALLKSPLLIGSNPAKLTPEDLAILTAPEVIAVNQDPLGVQGDLVHRVDGADVWAGPLSGGRRAIVLLNRGEEPNTLSVSFSDIGLDPSLPVSVRDLWARQDLGEHTGSFSAAVPRHGVVMITASQSGADDKWRPTPPASAYTNPPAVNGQDGAAAPRIVL